MEPTPFSVFEEADKALKARRKALHEGGARDDGTFTLTGYSREQAHAIATVLRGAFNVVVMQHESRGNTPMGVQFVYEVEGTSDAVHGYQYDETTRTATFNLPGGISIADMEKSLVLMKRQIVDNSYRVSIQGMPGAPDGQYYVNLFQRLQAPSGDYPMLQRFSRMYRGGLADIAREIVYSSARANGQPEGSFVTPRYEHRDKHYDALVIPAAQFDQFVQNEKGKDGGHPGPG